MRKYVPFKSSIRQPVRALIFVLLIGLASFGFVSRAVEYIIINREINRIERFYRTTGALVPIDPATHNSVYDAAELLLGSSLIEFYDRRTITQGIMHDRPNALRGFHTVGGNVFMRGEPPFDYKGLYPFDSIVILEVEATMIRPLVLPVVGNITTNRVTFRSPEVLFGHEQFLPRRYIADILVNEDGTSAANILQRGGRYLARASRQSYVCNTIEIFPLTDDIYFVCMTDQETISNVMQILAREIAGIEQNTNMLTLTGTKDMTALPMVQNRAMMPALGRFVTYEDYVNANPVAVIPWRMYSPRLNNRIGETITLTLRDMRTFVDGAPFPPEEHFYARRLPPGIEGHWANMPAGYWVSIPRDYEGNWRNYQTIEIELEIIGTYRVWDMPRWEHISDSFQNMEVFVPASVIPEGFGIVDAHIVSGAYSFVLNSPRDIPRFTVRYGSALAEMGFYVQFSGPDAANFWRSALPIRNAIRLNLILFSAVLAVALALTVFLYLKQRYKEFAIMRVLGANVKNSTWQVLMPVLIIWIPIVIFSSAVGWNFAIYQAESNLQILAEIDIGAEYAGTPVVQRNILEQMRFDAEQALAEDEPLIEIQLLFILLAALFAVWVLAVLVGIWFFAKQSMISLIQSSQGGGAVVPMAKETAPPKNIKVSDVFLLTTIARSCFGRFMSGMRHHARHILRAPVKTLLVLGMALLFVAALGWLDSTITFTENEIERLKTTTPISGYVIDAESFFVDDTFGHEIPLESLEALTESGFIDEYFYTVLPQGLGLFPPMDLPEDFVFDSRRLFGVRLGPQPVAAQDSLKLFNCWDMFIREVTRPVEFGAGMDIEFNLIFAEGYSEEDFVASYEIVEDEGGEEIYELHTLPIIVHESLLERDLMAYSGGIIISEPFFDGYEIEQRLSLGDYAYLGFATFNPTQFHVKIIGVYSGGHPRSAYRAGQGLVLLPFGVFGGNMATLNFTIRQDMVPYLQEFENEIAERLIFTRENEFYHEEWGLITWTEDFAHIMVLNDAELTMVVAPLEENLNLLRLLYPVALVVSFILALGLSLLLMLQNAKNAAILRVLGKSSYKTRFNLCAELLSISITGAAVGFAAVLFMGVGINTAGLLVGIYLAGALVGVFAGVLVISHKPPMDLLQVRE